MGLPCCDGQAARTKTIDLSSLRAGESLHVCVCADCGEITEYSSWSRPTGFYDNAYCGIKLPDPMSMEEYMKWLAKGGNDGDL